MNPIAARDFEKSPGNLIGDAKVVVLYGDNIQIKRDIFRSIRRFLGIESEDPFRLISLSSEAIDADRARLADELGAISMFGGSRLIHVDSLARQVLEILDLAAAAPSGEWLLVVDVDDLDANRLTGLKAYKQAIAVACGLEGAGDFHAFVKAEFHRAGAGVDDGVLEFLIPLLGEDRAAARGEVEKLSLLTGNSGTITIEQAARVAADSSSVLSDEIAAAAFSGSLTAMCAALDRLQSTGSDAPAALGAASRLALNLYRGKINQWGSRGGLGQNLSPADLRRLALIVQNAVLQTRSDSANAPLLAERALVSLGASTRPRRR